MFVLRKSLNHSDISIGIKVWYCGPPFYFLAITTHVMM